MKQLKPALYGLTIRAANYRNFKGPAGQSGATAIEYALIAALIAVAIIAGAEAVGLQIGNLFDSIAGDVEDAAGG